MKCADSFIWNCLNTVNFGLGHVYLVAHQINDPDHRYAFAV